MSSVESSGNGASNGGGEDAPLGAPEGQIIVLILPEENYTERLMIVVGNVANFGGRICYISLNRPYGSLMKLFKKCGIDSQNFYFIDAITSTAKVPEESSDCEFVSSPGALTELSVAIAKAMERESFDYLLFDSLSTLLVYESDTTIAKFVHFLMAKVRVVGCNALFTCLKQDSGSILVKDINMFADKVIDIEKWHMR